MKIKVKILACCSLLALSTASLAGTMTFSVINDSRSLQNPITITQGHIQYGSIAPGCSGGQVKDISGLQISSTEKTPIQVDTSVVPPACWASGQGVVFQLAVDTVDGQAPASAPCGTFLKAYSPDDNVVEQRPLTIFTTTDGFICHLVGP